MDAAQLGHVRSAKSADTSARDAQDAGEVRRWGIGIAVVHAIVAKHGGWIDAISAPGAGTTVFLTLPLLHPGPEAAAASVPTAKQTP